MAETLDAADALGERMRRVRIRSVLLPLAVRHRMCHDLSACARCRGISVVLTALFQSMQILFPLNERVLMNYRMIKNASVIFAVLAAVLMVSDCSKGSGITVTDNTTLPDTLIDAPVTVPAGDGGEVDVTFNGTRNWRIRVTLTASNPNRQPYGLLDASSFTSLLSTPPVETSSGGINTVELALPVSSLYYLYVLEGTKLGGSVRVLVVRIQ